VKDNGTGTHTETIKDGNGNTTPPIIKEGATGADGKNAEADVKDNGNGTQTVTIKQGTVPTSPTRCSAGGAGAKGDGGG
ncbi:collagen-flanked surface repeat-containing protein, partial [Neisseria sp. P0017.S003]|uniref:collagen-flanked surface repeat-containing protein n=1 Tax=Neisseria sp. P0017.S003 TaxID=3436779 RepID=UPI003F7FE8F2